MGKATHTPGPWFVDEYCTIRRDASNDDECAKIAEYHQGYSGEYGNSRLPDMERREAYANARLISAAPDLLETLLESRSIGDRLARGVAVSKDEIRAANARQAAAIQKATGGQS